MDCSYQPYKSPVLPPTCKHSHIDSFSFSPASFKTQTLPLSCTGKLLCNNPYLLKCIVMTYPYQPLLSSNEIRLLIFNPSSAGSDITCQLVHSDLASCPYEALSYEWGLPSDEDPEILVDDHFIGIRRNLYLALQQFRHETEQRILWIDAICINQSDTEEKGRQVQFIGTIYGKADMALVWVGVEDSDTYLAYNCLHRVAALFPELGTGVKLEEVQESDALVAEMGLAEDEEYKLTSVTLSKIELGAVRNLMERPYWYHG
jgi:hypothetical protein